VSLVDVVSIARERVAEEVAIIGWECAVALVVVPNLLALLVILGKVVSLSVSVTLGVLITIVCLCDEVAQDRLRVSEPML
jgi:hypothetical protein